MKFDIYYRHITGAVDHCGTTDNPEKWLEENNKERYKNIVCCDEYDDEHKEKICSCIEDIDDFEIKEWWKQVCNDLDVDYKKADKVTIFFNKVIVNK